MQVTREEWVEWKLHPVSKAVWEFLINLHKESLESWGSGAYTADTAEATAILNAEALGRVDAIKRLLELDEETLNVK